MLSANEGKETRKRRSQRLERTDAQWLASTAVGATWRFEGDLALLALGVVPDKRVPQEVRGDGPSVGVRFEAAQDEQLGVHRQRLGHLGVNLEHADLPTETGMKQTAPESQTDRAAAGSYLEHGRLRFSQLVERRLSSGHFYDGASQGPDVGRGSVPPGALIDDLWSHVLQSPCQRGGGPDHQQTLKHSNGQCGGGACDK